MRFIILHRAGRRRVPLSVARVIGMLLAVSAVSTAQPWISDAETAWNLDGTRWARLSRPPLVSWQHAPYAGRWDATGLQLRYYPKGTFPLGLSLGFHQVLGGRAREVEGPMGNSILAFRSSEVTLLARTTSDAPRSDRTDYEVLAAWSGIAENDPLNSILTTLRFRGGYRGAGGETRTSARHQLFAEGLLATNTIALGISDLYYGVEGERGMYGPRTLRLYAGLVGYFQFDPDVTSGLEPFGGFDGAWEFTHASPSLLYGAEVRYNRQIEWSARAGVKFGRWMDEGLFVDVSLRGSEQTPAVAGIGVGYEISR